MTGSSASMAPATSFPSSPRAGPFPTTRKEVTYKLRDDATFADGSPVEASDVVYTVERLLRINQGPANLFAGVLAPGSVTAVDAKTVKFTLSKTFAPFLTTVPAIIILNEELVTANAKARR
jgi:peptide/nickel transport system substrate-binding protein